MKIHKFHDATLDFGMRDYPVHLTYEDEEWIAKYPDLPGCMGVGSTQVHAMRSLVMASLDVVEWMVEEGEAIPEPSSGALVVVMQCQ
jgi:predicted RNase H-like HicB family nuclease